VGKTDIVELVQGESCFRGVAQLNLDTKGRLAVLPATARRSLLAAAAAW
jgi:hypothetical protein